MDSMQPQNSRHVLFLQGSTTPGGSKQSLLSLIQVLRETVYRPAVICPEQGWLTEQLEQLQTPYVLAPFFAWRKWLERPRVLPSIRRHWLPALACWRFDIIHSNEFWWAPHAIEVAKHLKIPAAVHLRDGHHTLKKAGQYGLKHADAVLAVSTDLRSQFTADPELYNKTLVLFNGHEEKIFRGRRETAREMFGLGSEEFVLGNAGRLSERKNQRLVLTVMAQLKQQRRVTQFKILFAGEPDPDYAGLMAQDIQRLGLQQEVKFLGDVQDMGAFFSAADLVVHCARREGLPRVVPEAMLARKAVVAVEAQGVRDAIPEEQFGCVVPLDNQEALENRIEQLSKDPGLRQRIGEQAYRHARSLFSLEAHRDSVVKLYGDLIGMKDKTRQRALTRPTLSSNS